MSDARTHRLMPETTFAGRFRVDRVIGEGAMGTVYLAIEDLEGGEERPCALKVLKPSHASAESKHRERFAREARVGDRIGSPHVVKVFDAGYDEATGLDWLAMELLEGLSLTLYLDRRDPSPTVRRRLLRQLFEAIAAAHRAGVIHRDLKPDNLFVVDIDGEPSLKVLDFGVAKTLRASMVASATEGGLGTPLWTAPEQGKRGVIQPSVDVWALGLLTFYLLSGKVYWYYANQPSASMLDIAQEMLRAPIAAASTRAEQLEVADRIPALLDDWFAHCVVRDPAERFEDADQAHAALEEVLAGRPSTRPPSAKDHGSEASTPSSDGEAATSGSPPSSATATDEDPKGAPVALIVALLVVLLALGLAMADSFSWIFR
ncbi:MAG: serine/threonine-protein kinase [Polyangiaceae bacterium]